MIITMVIDLFVLFVTLIGWGYIPGPAATSSVGVEKYRGVSVIVFDEVIVLLEGELVNVGDCDGDEQPARAIALPAKHFNASLRLHFGDDIGTILTYKSAVNNFLAGMLIF